ncbi:MAG: succinyl-diaminopimelate desuccinylase [Anaeromyxobacteraceae bacterium]
MRRRPRPAEVAESLAERAEALCAISSPIGEEEELCGELETWARALFPAVTRVKSSLVVWVDGSPSDRPLLALVGHIDTVPIHELDRGRQPRREGGRLVGPGASDMKGGVAVMMELAERLPRAERFCDLVLVLYAREEGPFAENELGDVLREVPALSRAALAICPEPTDNLLQLGCMGSIHATFTFTGRAAHSARPWQGENAIQKAGALLAELHGRAPREASSGGHLFREVLSVTRIDGGRARNVVPERCALNLNFRFAPDKTLEAASDELRALATSHGAAIELVDLSPACPAYGDDPLVVRLLARTGVKAEPKQAWTDVARLAAQGIPAVNFGPGTTSQAHQQGEWLDLAELARGYALFEKFLRS